MDMNKKTILVVLSDQEWDDFLPGETGEWLRAQPGFQELDPTSLDGESWEKALRKIQPEVVVCCWKAPAFPSEPELWPRYVCYLAGSVRKKVPREMITSGVLVTNWASSISRTVAECALLLTLSGLRRSNYWALTMHHEANWKNPAYVNLSLFKRRVGLHGFGAISRALVALLRPFEVTIRTFSPSVPDAVLEEQGVERADTLEDLFSTSQVLVELAGNTPQNYHIVTEDLLRRLPPDGVFVNVGRGAVVDEEALVKIALEGQLQIALDVYENEPLAKDHPFRGLHNVTLLPHIGGPTSDRRCDAGENGMVNLKAYLEGKPLPSVISAQAYDRAT